MCQIRCLGDHDVIITDMTLGSEKSHRFTVHWHQTAKHSKVTGSYPVEVLNFSNFDHSKFHLFLQFMIYFLCIIYRLHN